MLVVGYNHCNKVDNVTTVYPVTSARNLGVVFDNIVNMDTHATAISRSAHFHLRNIGAIDNTSPLNLQYSFVMHSLH